MGVGEKEVREGELDKVIGETLEDKAADETLEPGETGVWEEQCSWSKLSMVRLTRRWGTITSS